jgi:hypothetical protein
MRWHHAVFLLLALGGQGLLYDYIYTILDQTRISAIPEIATVAAMIAVNGGAIVLARSCRARAAWRTSGDGGFKN